MWSNLDAHEKYNDVKKLIFIALASISISAHCQDTYTASTGVTYKIGDEVMLVRGAGAGGKFIYFQVGGMARSTNDELNMMPASMAGIKVRIKKIKNWKIQGQDRIYFVTPGRTGAENGYLFIENAIKAGEVEEPLIKP